MFDDEMLICKDCKTEFIFTAGEQEFYQEKGLINKPQRCRICRNAKKSLIRKYEPFITVCSECGGEAKLNFKPHDNRPVFCSECFLKKKSITAHNSSNKIHLLYEEINKWSIEAKKEDVAYFYNVKETNLIINGQKSFVIGRKGAGKTSIAQYLIDMEYTDTFSVPLSFKNFPFKILYSLENQGEYTAPNQYISMWKYLIFSCVCQKMIVNQNIDVDVQEKLIKLYGGSSIDNLDKLIKKWTSKGFGVSILGNGVNYEREPDVQELTWLETMGILQNIIVDYCDSSKYFIIFDELDEDYKNFENQGDYEKYIAMLTSLFKAVQDIRSSLDAKGKNILPVVFLRSDIFDRIKDSDKNKWNESIINLKWDRPEIQGLLSHRLCVALNEPTSNDFNSVWYKLFEQNKVSMGNQKHKEMEIYPYIERSTEMRPRDFIQYIKECVMLNNTNPRLISPQTVKDADENFSEYLKRETIDEAFATLPEIDDILGLLSTIRKQEFRFEAFEEEYNALVEQGTIQKRDVKHVLLILFEVGVIGNKPSMRGKSIFKFSEKSTPRFNFKETMQIHRGLFKALQIF